MSLMLALISRFIRRLLPFPRYLVRLIHIHRSLFSRLLRCWRRICDRLRFFSEEG